MTDNEKYVKRGQALIIGDDPQRHEEVAAANRNKVSAPFQYAESLFAALAVVKSMTGLPIETLGDWDVPCYTTIYRRFQSLKVKRNGNVFTITGGGTVLIRLAVDSTGLKQYNRGEWIRHKWKVRRGFVKLHVMVDVDTKKILAVQVTDDRTGDSPMLVPLLDDALENCVPQTSESGHAGGSTRCSAYGDGAYASRDNLKACRGPQRDSIHQTQGKLHPKGKRCRRRVGHGSQGSVWRL